MAIQSISMHWAPRVLQWHRVGFAFKGKSEDDMTAFVSVKVKDFSGEISYVRFPVAEMEAATTWAASVVIGAALRSQVDALSLGTTVNWSWTQDAETPDEDLPASALAQREDGFRVFYHGNTTGKKAHLTIPARDISAVTIIPATDLVDLTVGAGAAFVTAFETYVTLPIPSEVTGYWNDATTVDKIQVIGRNN